MCACRHQNTQNRSVTKCVDLRRSLKFSTCPYVASSTFHQKNRSFCFLPLLCEGKKVSEVSVWIPPPGAHPRRHCSVTRDSSRCYSSSQANAASPSPPASAKIFKLKTFRPTVVISPSPSYLKINGLFTRYFHPISGSFESFNIKVFFPKQCNEASGSWVYLEGRQGCCSTPQRAPECTSNNPREKVLIFPKRD